MTNKIIQSLWVGSLSTMEKLCLRSFMANGHEFHLYSYEPLTGVPEGVIVKDANEILPKHKLGEFAQVQVFADVFRYALLLQKGGWYVDMDTICLKPFDFENEYVFVQADTRDTKDAYYIFSGFLKAPAGSPLMQWCYNQSLAWLGNAQYQAGPKLVREAVLKFNMQKCVVPGKFFDPIHWYGIGKAIDPAATWDLSESYAAHMFRSIWKSGPNASAPIDSPTANLLADADHPADCLYTQLKNKYGVNGPLVTCICPTANRQNMIFTAIRSFLSQTYTNSELLILDDGEKDTTVPSNPRIRYVRLEERNIPIGAKRNMCCEHARGEIIAHFDDDDWSHPARLAQQVARLKSTGKKLTGYYGISYHDAAIARAFQFLGVGDGLKNVTGTSQCYYKSFWRTHPFPDTRLEEDRAFSETAKQLGELDSIDGVNMIVARRHSTNSWGAGTDITSDHRFWKDIPVSSLPSGFLADSTPDPAVSIVITTFNRPWLLQATLASFTKQAYKDYEIIVIDDGDDPDTQAICKEGHARHVRLNRVQTVQYKNPSLPINIGLRMAKGEVIILQNAECKHIDPEAIQKLSSLVRDDNVVFARVHGLKPDGSFDWLYCGKESQRPYFFCGAMKRTLFEKLRGFDEDYTGAGYDDNDFGDRLKKEGLSLEFTDILVHHQYHIPAGTQDYAPMERIYLQKTADMAAGRIGTTRNLNREWGKYVRQEYKIPPPAPTQTVFKPAPKPAGRYSADTLTIDWWSTHAR